MTQVQAKSKVQRVGRKSRPCCREPGVRLAARPPRARALPAGREGVLRSGRVTRLHESSEDRPPGSGPRWPPRRGGALGGPLSFRNCPLPESTEPLSRARQPLRGPQRAPAGTEAGARTRPSATQPRAPREAPGAGPAPADETEFRP